ncbi:MAG TPA: hypothetical protein VGI39_40375 [Polyangiaceae bacterium]|jgi:hypothetical protein
MKSLSHLGRTALQAAVAATLLTGAGAAMADDAKRPVPDYDGRPAPPTTAGDAALWVPRIVFFPLWLTSEFVLRRPMGAFLMAAERNNWPTALYDFFAFGPDHKAGFAPLVFADFGFNPSVGLYLFWNDAFFKGNDLSVHGATWGTDWIAGSLTERVTFHDKKQLTFTFTGVRRPDKVFYGLGARSLESSQSRYGQDLLDARALLGLPMGHAARIDAGVGMRSVSIYHGHFGDDKSVEEQAAAGVYALPYGFGRGYTAEYNQLRLTLDSRPHPPGGSGVRLELDGLQGSDVRRDPASGWVQYGGNAGVFYDIGDYGRVIELYATARFADPLGPNPVPFTELVQLGGDYEMRGFYPGRLFGQSAAVATFRYRWPIAIWLDGSIHASVGNVFEEHLRDFDTKLLRFSGTLGISSRNSADGSIEALVGFGTETFEHGGQIDSIRILVGTNRGF